MLQTFASALLLSLLASSVVSTIPDVVYRSALSWPDANWPGELGSMPLGNGDIAMNVWVDSGTGSLIYYIAKSDAFDANANPLKVARVIIDFDPPLWTSSTSFFNQTLSPATGSISIVSGQGSQQISVTVFADANSNTVYVSAQSSQSFSVTASLDVYRNATVLSNLGWGLCYPFYQTADTVVDSASSSLNDSIVWYHRNWYPNSTYNYYNNTLRQQGVDPNIMADPFINRTFGGALFGSQGISITSQTSISGSNLESVILTAVVYTSQCDDVNDWLSVVASTAQTQSQQNYDNVFNSHMETWENLWNRTYVDITSSNNSNISGLEIINQKYIWQRFLDLADGRLSSSAIKFNGQSFVVDVGNGPDYRDWGASYWWQNTRQPYYNALVTGDFDLLIPMYQFYLKSLPIIKQRVAVEYNNISGGVWPESTTQFGTMNPNDWGCDTSIQGPSTNCYMRYHTTGSLELCMIILDHYILTNDINIILDYGLPVLTTSLETWQCPDPTSRTQCVTGPITDIGGLFAVLTRALQLPSIIIAPYITQWQKQLDLLPDLPTGMQSGSSILLPGYQLPSSPSNSENTNLYPVHPFRIFGLNKTNVELAINTYNQRQFPCNDGWCQDVIDAAMLGLVDDAAEQVLQRALDPPASGWRFGGFSQHFQDYEPSLDHLSFMRTAIHYMLVQPLDDEAQTVQLFGGWPTDQWDVSFQLLAPLNTTIEASCVGGKLAFLNVTPASRLQDVVVLNCQQ